MPSDRKPVHSPSLRKTFKNSIRKSVAKTPKYALVVLHTKTSKIDRDRKSIIDYISLALDLLIFGYFAAIGTIYTVNKGGESACFIGVPLFLMIAGYTNVVLSVLRFFLPLVGTISQCTFNLAMCIYGGVLIFSRYGKWESVDHTKPNYCNPLPFLTAFVFVIVTILWFAVILIVVIIVLLVGLTVGFKAYKGSNLRPSEQILIISQSEFKKLAKDVRGETDRVKGLGRRKKGSSKVEAAQLSTIHSMEKDESDDRLRPASDLEKGLKAGSKPTSKPPVKGDAGTRTHRLYRQAVSRRSSTEWKGSPARRRRK